MLATSTTPEMIGARITGMAPDQENMQNFSDDAIFMWNTGLVNPRCLMGCGMFAVSAAASALGSAIIATGTTDFKNRKLTTAARDAKQHVSIVICGHVDAGKSTTTGRLIFQLGGIHASEMQQLKDEAKKQRKSFDFAFYMSNSEKNMRGLTIACTTKEFYTDSYHYTIIDAPGHRDFMKNMITGASQADVGLLLVPGDGNFIVSIAKGDHKTGQVQGQTRQHARLLNLLGVKQLIVGVSKMDCDVAKYGKDRFIEIKNETTHMLTKVGWKKDFVAKSVPVLPISGWQGDNVIAESTNMDWYKGMDIIVDKEKIHIHTLADALEKMVKIPKRPTDAKLRMPVSGVYKIAGVGDVITGRVEQGKVSPDDQIMFLPTHSVSTPCQGKVFSVEMHHKQVPSAMPGDNVGLNIKGLDKLNMPRVGDVMVLQSDTSLNRCVNFTAQVQILDHPGQLKKGYSPVAFVRAGRSACKITKIDWKVGKEAGGAKVEDPEYVKANEVAQIVFKPQQPFVVEEFKQCEGLGRVAIMEGNTVVMLGKAIKVEFAPTV